MKHKKLSNCYLSEFCAELSMLLCAGITPAVSIMMLLDDESDKDAKTVLESIAEPLNNGEPISSALKNSVFFPKYLCNMAEAGEKTGRLADTFKALSEHYERQERIAVSIKNAVLYPSILLVMMIVVVLILIIQVLPIFNDVFNQLGSRMSPLAIKLMQFGGWLSNASAVIAIVFGLVFVLALLLRLFPALRKALTSGLINIWCSRGIFKNIAYSRFTSAMALATASGLDSIEAVDMASAISGGVKTIESAQKKCGELLRSGESLAEAMHKSGIINARNCRLLSLGSRSGMTDSVMADIAEKCERDVQEQIDRTISRIEPVLVIITSSIVGIILLSVMLPLMGIMTSIG